MKTQKVKSRLILKLIFLIAIILPSCVSQKKVRLLQEKTVKEVTEAFVYAKKPDYTVKTGDHLYINVRSMDPKTSKFFQSDFPTYYGGSYLYLHTYTVDQEGYINFYFIEKMQVRGLTVEETQKRLQSTLNEYFNDVTIQVKLVNFQVAVLGEVISPGTFTIEKDQINIFQAIGMAGGINTFGNIKKVTLVRQTNTGSQVNYLDLSDNTVLSSEYFFLMPDDLIYIEPRAAKSFALEKFPYTFIISSVALAVSLMAIFQ